MKFDLSDLKNEGEWETYAGETLYLNNTSFFV